MDMFMDKLAQRATAQEIINANSLAETEELNRLRSQIDEYDKCLERLKQLLDGGAGNQQDGSDQSEQIQKLLTEGFENVDLALDEHLDDMDTSLEQWLGDMNNALERRFLDLNQSLEERLNQLDGKLNVQTDDRLDEKLLPITDTVHKECVKVYRNVQAVVMEESGKQTELLNSAASGTNRLGRKLNLVFGVSLAALLASLFSIVIQIMKMMNIPLF